MTTKPRSPAATSDNERSSVNSDPGHEEPRGVPSATGLKREGSGSTTEDVLRSFGLSGPAQTPPPQELRSISTMGARRVAVEKSAYAVRSERKGQLVELVEFLRRVRAEVDEGGSLSEAVADGTLWGWRARQALSHCLGLPVATWDAEHGRTRLERLALVERALAECGVEHKGGWRVGDGR